MKEKVIDILVRIAHISETLKILVVELDKMYEVLGDTEFLKTLEKELKK